MTQSDIVLVNLSNMGIRQVNQHVFPFSVMPWLKKGSYKQLQTVKNYL